MNIRVKDFYATTLIYTGTLQILGHSQSKLKTKITVTFVQEKNHNVGTRCEACSAVGNLQLNQVTALRLNVLTNTR